MAPGTHRSPIGDYNVRILFWLITIPFLALAGAFAAANHEALTLKFWPFPLEVQVPVYVAVIGAFLLGLAVAALWFWAAGLGDRLAKRRLMRHERALEQETERLKRELSDKSRILRGTDGTGRPGGEASTLARRVIAAGD